MLSSKILKANSVYIDEENKVLIDTASSEIPTNAAADEPELDLMSEANTPEEIAKITLINANRKAENIIKDALREAEAIIQEAAKNAESEAREILSQSREQGHREGLYNAEKESNQIRAQANIVLEEAQRERQAMEASLEPDMVNLIISVINKLLGDTVRLEPAAVINLIKQGLAGATLTGDITIHVSPHDYDIVVENKDTLQALADASVKMDISKDLSLNPNDCVIETPYGSIDSSLGQQFETLRSNLIHILNS
jgi:flagellar assembly protein FliH